MTFQTTLQQNPDGEFYITLPPELGWIEGDEIQLNIMTDLDSGQPVLLMTRPCEQERT